MTSKEPGGAWLLLLAASALALCCALHLAT